MIPAAYLSFCWPRTSARVPSNTTGAPQPLTVLAASDVRSGRQPRVEFDASQRLDTVLEQAPCDLLYVL